MKKVFIFSGAAVVALVIITAACVLLFKSKANQLNKDSKEYADTVIVRIISDWDKQELIKQASSEFTGATNSQRLERAFEQFRKLGKLKEYKGSVGKSNMSIDLRLGDVICANYLATADFEAGSVKIRINIVRHADSWRIFAFNVYPKLLGDSR